MKVTVSINKAGSLKITAYPAGCRIYAFPSDCYKGKLIGVDSTVYSGAPGTCWFEFQAPGYRSQRAACNIRPDTTTTLSIDLKPAIPLMVLSPDTLKCGSSNLITDNGSISFADLNRDRIPDLSIATAAGIICYYGIDSTDNSLFSPIKIHSFQAPGAITPPLYPLEQQCKSQLHSSTQNRQYCGSSTKCNYGHSCLNKQFQALSNYIRCKWRWQKGSYCR